MLAYQIFHLIKIEYAALHISQKCREKLMAIMIYSDSRNNIGKNSISLSAFL